MKIKKIWVSILLIIGLSNCAQKVKVLENMTLVKGGTFTMGCRSEPKDCGYDDLPCHEVTIGDFYISKYEITFTEYDKFCEATGCKKPDDEGWGRGKRPVINVSLHDAVTYCKWKSNQGNGIGFYRLPTEAEWEYAARGGNQNKDYEYAGSNDIDKVA